ncbi:MAG: hypothetical protein K5880_10530 [Hydrogenophaga sp.]|uniref:hypothetical protein n=1 Tax=Hydrogenophaga sp. TaxID=1904254 RepID=UPI00260A9C68|nr:hypothetical protein [Hydrogenophaga sp.]MCV0439059.1 hypothetical protein [Hydrogenophaga sp.]
MNQADITRLVVGEPITLSIGRSVGQSATTVDASKVLQWRDGKWQGTTNLLEKIAVKRPAKLLVFPARSAKRVPIRLSVPLLAGLLAIGGIGAGIGALLRPERAPLPQPVTVTEVKVPELPVVPVTTPADAVRSVDEPYQAPAETNLQMIETHEAALPPQPTAQAAAPSLPIAPPRAETPPLPTPLPSAKASPERTQPPKTAPETKVAARDVAKGPSKGAKEEPRPPAVLLDELADKHPKAASPQRVAGTSTDKPVAAPVAPIAQASAGRGLLAITPDGKFAVFTDPATKLPRQFKAGDKLPSGDTIKAIDAKTGKVSTGAKEYTLE